MTLDATHRSRHGDDHRHLSNSDEAWKDWTSTWRKIGTNGHIQPVTMTGTIKRGKKKGQVVDVQLDLTDREYMELTGTHDRTNQSVNDSETSESSKITRENCCSLYAGPHVFLWSLVTFPFIFLASFLTAFYFGALTWQNVFTHYYECSIWQRIFFCPLLVIFFPLLIVVMTLGIAAYAAFIQIRWFLPNWKDEVSSLEKGFYGWLCTKLKLEDCSPYLVVELVDTQNGICEDGVDGTGNSTGDRGNRQNVAVVSTERDRSHRPLRDGSERSSNVGSGVLPYAVQNSSLRMESTL